jgi:hypothetical protein
MPSNLGPSYSSRPATVLSIILLFYSPHPNANRQKKSPSRVQHSHLQRETVVKFGEGNGIVHKRPLHTTVYDTSPGAWYLQKSLPYTLHLATS